MMQTKNEIYFFIEESIEKFNTTKIYKTLKKELCLQPINFIDELPESVFSTYAKKIGKYELELYKIGRSEFKIYIEKFYTLSFGNKINQMVISLVPKNDYIKELIEEIIKNS